MDLEQLEAFVQLARHGSILLAARSLGMARTTVARRIAALQASSGVPLYVTDARGTRLTERGCLLAEEATVLLRQARALEDGLRAPAAPPRGVVHGVMPPGLHPALVGTSLIGLAARHPEVTIDLRVATEPAAATGPDVDLAFVVGAPPKSERWVARVLAHIPFRLLGTEAYLQAHGTPTDLADLADHRLLCRRSPERDDNLLPLLDGSAWPVTPAVLTEDFYLTTRMMRLGGGLALCPVVDIPDDGPADARPRAVLDDLVGETVPLWMLLSKVQARSPRVRALVEDVLAVVEGHPQL